ncbi:iron uptake porin, partial [Microcoleus sp. Pol12B4]|uniref:iron uptake porin n=1 Tax=Microcoleus sp. Pol12B4 TaxID=3055395 RepID=UPI002FD1A1DE
MVNNATSVKAFWLSFLISGAAVPLGPISATAQIQDTSTPEVALEASAVPTATPDAALAASKIEIPQLAAITAAETNSAVDRPLPDTDAAWVNRALPQTDIATVDRALPDTDAAVDRALPDTDAAVDRALPDTDATVDRALPETDIATVDRALPQTDAATVDRATTAPEITGAIRELPPQELEIANSPQSQQVAEASKVADISSETGTADDLSIQEDAAQVTSVSQLSDVRPTDWAFQALQSLVERYGCIAGYPDGTFRGNRAMTRYEFAAGLNACLDQITKQLGGSTGNLVKREDLLALQRLQEEFAAELATLRGRVDALEARTAELEANQFSTTTKLNGFAWFNLTGAFASKRVRVEATNGNAAPLDRVAGRDPVTNRPIVQRVDDDPEITFSQLVWLTLTTSFTGKDELITQLAVGNGNSPANQYTSTGLFNTFGTPFLDQTAGVNPNEVTLRELS